LESGAILRKYIHFDNAVQQKLPVTVCQNGEILDYGGPIEHHDLHKVTINGMHYVKTACVFVIR
jgi:hypothetical protein